MKFKIILTVLITSIYFIACGSVSETSNTPSSNTPTPSTKESSILTGTFIDAPVEGLEYRTVSLSGYTNSNGHFQYKSGENISFFIGDLELGRVLGSKIITPLTLSSENDLNNIGTKATNIARILQTFDSFPSIISRLTIPPSLQNLKISMMDLESEADINSIVAKAQEITGINYILIDSQSAKNTMIEYIQNNTFDKITEKIPDSTINNTLNKNIDFKACHSCHGQNFEKNALGKSKIVKNMTKSQVTTALLGYKYDTYGGVMKGLMKGQVSKYSDATLRNSGLGR